MAELSCTVRRGARLLLCPRATGQPPKEYREDPVRAVLANEFRAADLVNPFAVGRRPAGRHERPAYWVAVARKPVGAEG